MRRQKRVIWWESGVAGRPGPRPRRVPEYDEWARHHVDGFQPQPAYVPPLEPRVAGTIPERLLTLGEALTKSLAEKGHSVPRAATEVGTTSEQFIDWALDRADPGTPYDQPLMAYLGIDYYTLRGLTLRSQMRRVQLRIHRLPA